MRLVRPLLFSLALAGVAPVGQAILPAAGFEPAPSRLIAGCSLKGCPTETIDRIAVTVDDRVITQSELLGEIRLTAFLNAEQPEFSPAARRAAAERLVEQHLLLRDMELTRFPSPPPDEVERALQHVRQTHSARYHSELARAGISEQDLRARLARQAAVLRYIDFRFKPEVQASTAETLARQVDELVERWLKEARERARIRYREAAFQ